VAHTTEQQLQSTSNVGFCASCFVVCFLEQIWQTDVRVVWYFVSKIITAWHYFIPPNNVTSGTRCVEMFWMIWCLVGRDVHTTHNVEKSVESVLGQACESLTQCKEVGQWYHLGTIHDQTLVAQYGGKACTTISEWWAKILAGHSFVLIHSS